MTNCNRCRAEFTPVRLAQVYCCARCRDVAKKHRKRSGDKGLKRGHGVSDAPRPLSDGSTVGWPSRDEQRGPTPGALQGDDVTLEYYEDGYPKLPACLDRRTAKLIAKAA